MASEEEKEWKKFKKASDREIERQRVEIYSRLSMESRDEYSNQIKTNFWEEANTDWCNWTDDGARLHAGNPAMNKYPQAQCEIEATSTGSEHSHREKIIDLLQDDPLWLYDRCVFNELWSALKTDDLKYVREIGVALTKYASRRDGEVKSSQSRMDSFYLRNFLFQLDWLGVCHLRGPKANGWGKAYSLVCEILKREKLLGLRNKDRFRDSERFRKSCSKWFSR